MPIQLREATGKLEKAGGRKYHARLIEGDIWGSSGYYSKQVLESDGPATWPAGTQIYLDHPGATENFDRPERSVRDLAGKITSTPAYESDGLYADVEFYPHYAPIIEAMWEDVGMSIRASASVENGEIAGKRGPIIQSLENGLSVDVVTRAGAGGKLVSLLESARESAPATVDEATANNTREWLSDAVRANGGWAWVRDFDESTVYYERSATTADGGLRDAIYKQGYTLNGNTATLTGEPVEVKPEVIYTPVTQQTAEESAPKDSASSPAAVTENQEEAIMATIDDKELADLRESASRASTAEADTTTATERATKAEEALTKANDRAATAIVEAAFTAAGITAPKTAARLSKGYPVAESGELDDAKLTADVAESIAELAESNGAGQVRGLGTSGGDGAASAVESNKAIASAFGRTVKEA